MAARRHRSSMTGAEERNEGAVEVPKLCGGVEVPVQMARSSAEVSKFIRMKPDSSSMTLFADMPAKSARVCVDVLVTMSWKLLMSRSFAIPLQLSDYVEDAPMVSGGASPRTVPTV